MGRPAADPDIQLAAFDALHLLGGGHLPQPQGDVGMTLAIPLDRVRKERLELGGGGESDPQLAAFAGLGQCHGGPGGGDLRHDAPGMVEKDAAGRGDRHASLAAVEQLAAHLAFELLDLQAERRLADIETLGGAAEIQFLRHRDEVAQMPYLHTQFLP